MNFVNARLPLFKYYKPQTGEIVRGRKTKRKENCIIKRERKRERDREMRKGERERAMFSRVISQNETIISGKGKFLFLSSYPSFEILYTWINIKLISFTLRDIFQTVSFFHSLCLPAAFIECILIEIFTLFGHTNDDNFVLMMKIFQL